MAFAGHASWFGYYAVWNEVHRQQLPGQARHLDQPGRGQHRQLPVLRGAQRGASSSGTGKQILSLYVSDCAPGLNSRLYVGLRGRHASPGCLLPYGTPNPAHPDSGCEFTDDESWVYWPLHHAMFQADAKAYRGSPPSARASAPRTRCGCSTAWPSSSRRCPLASRPRGSTSAARSPSPGSASTSRTTSSATPSRCATAWRAPPDVQHPRAGGHGPARAGAPGVATGVHLDGQRPALAGPPGRGDRPPHPLADQGGLPGLGRHHRLGGGRCCPDEGIQAVSIVDYSEALAPVTKRYGADWDIAMKGVQFRTAHRLRHLGSGGDCTDWDTHRRSTTGTDLLYL